MALSIISIIVAVAVALVVIYRDIIRDWFFRPSLEIEFTLGEPISRETFVKRPLVSPVGGEEIKKAFWPRLRITNTGRSVARKCEGILAEVRNPDGSRDKRYDPLTLRWAIAPEHTGLQPLDINCGRVVDLNIFTTIEGEKDAVLATYPDPRGIPLFLEPGDHWLCIVIYGDNFKPVRRGYAVHWDGKDYRRGVAMKEMNNKPSSVTAWPWLVGANTTKENGIEIGEDEAEEWLQKEARSFEEKFKRVIMPAASIVFISICFAMGWEFGVGGPTHALSLGALAFTTFGALVLALGARINRRTAIESSKTKSIGNPSLLKYLLKKNIGAQVSIVFLILGFLLAMAGLACQALA